MTPHNKFSLMEKLENGTFHSTPFYSLTHMFNLSVQFTFVSAPLHIRFLYILAVQCSLLSLINLQPTNQTAVLKPTMVLMRGTKRSYDNSTFN